MGKRYFANITTASDKRIVFEIWNSVFTGTAKELEVSADSLTLTQSGEHLFDPVRATAGSIVVTSETDFEFQPMMLEDDLANIVKIYDNGELVFSGYIENGMYEEEYVAPPYDVQISFTDGIKKLKGLFLDTDALLNKMYFNLTDLLRECLYPIMLPDASGNKYLFVNCSLHNEAFKDDLNWGCFEQVYMHVSALSGDSVAFYDVIEKVLEIFGATIFQHNGSWYVERIKNKLHNGEARFIRYDFSKAFNAVDNNGVAVNISGLSIMADSGLRFITDTPRYTTEKEYRYQEIDVDTTLKSTLVSNNFNLNKQRIVEGTHEQALGNDWWWGHMIYRDSVIPVAERYKYRRAPYCWYWPSEIQIPNQQLMNVDVVKNCYGISNGIKFVHKIGNNLFNHAHNETPCHVLFGSTVNLKLKVWIEFSADSITKKTWVIIPIRLNNVTYINTLDFPYKHNATPYLAGAVPMMGTYCISKSSWTLDLWLLYNYMTTAESPTGQSEIDGGPAGIYLCYNSEDDSDKFSKWYNGESVEVEFTLNNSGWLSTGSIDKQQRIDLTLYPSLFCDDINTVPTNDVSKIKSSTYGDIELSVDTSDSVESGYTVKNISDNNGYQIKREAPKISLKYWEGPPMYDYIYDAANSLLSCFYTNFQLKYLLLTPIYDDIYDKDESGNITGVKMIDGMSMNIDIVNTRKVDKWYDKNKPIGDYNKKSLLVERLVQDRFDCYAKARRCVNVTVHSDDIKFSSLYTYSMKHIADATFIATSITRKFDSDDYDITLEEIRDGIVKTSLFIPRNEAKNSTVTNANIPPISEWIM